jgi:hypothetical protein
VSSPSSRTPTAGELEIGDALRDTGYCALCGCAADPAKLGALALELRSPEALAELQLTEPVTVYISACSMCFAVAEGNPLAAARVLGVRLHVENQRESARWQ